MLISTPLTNKKIFEQSQEITVSPTMSKINSLNEKVKSIQTSAHQEKYCTKEFLQNKVTQMDDQLNRQQMQNDAKFKLINDQLDKITTTAQNEKTTLEICVQKKDNELQLVDKNVNLLINKLFQEKKELENRQTKSIDEKISQMKSEISRENQKRESLENDRKEQIVQSIVELKNDVEQEKVNCNEIQDSLVKTFGQEILKLSQILSEEKQIREQQHNNMLKILEDLNDSLTNQLNKENDERNQQEEMMLKLLEDTCQKIETSLTN